MTTGLLRAKSTLWCVTSALALAICVPAGADDVIGETFRTVIKGWQHRADMVQAFEGYVGRCTLYGAYGEPSHGDQYSRLPTAVLAYYAQIDDGSGLRWLCEERSLSLLEAVPKTSIIGFHDWVWARPFDNGHWMMTSKSGPDPPLQERLGSDIMLRGLPAQFINDHVKHVAVLWAELDGVPALRCRLVFKEAEEAAAVVDVWVDPAKGCAILKFESRMRGRDGEERFGIHSGHDFREYEPGLWLPSRTERFSIVRTQGQQDWVLDTFSTTEIIQAEINEPLSQHVTAFWAAVFKDTYVEYEPIAFSYDLMTADDVTLEIQSRDESGGTAPTRTTVRAIIAGLLEKLEKGPPDPRTLVGLGPDMPDL